MARSQKKRNVDNAFGKPAIVLGIFLLALTVRLIYLWQIRSSPFFDMPVADAGWHDSWARSLLQQHWTYGQVFFRAPLYPYFLAAVYALLGQGYLMARVAQAVLGSLSCLLVYALAGRLFSRSVALAAGVAASLYGMLIFFDAELLIVVLIVFLDLMMLWLFIGRDDRPGWIRPLLAGLVLGLSITARPNIVLFLPALFFWIWWKRGRRDRSALFQEIVLICLMIAVVILPVALHNLRRPCSDLFPGRHQFLYRQ